MKSKVIALLVMLGLTASGYAFDLEDLNFTGQYRLRWQMMENVLLDDGTGTWLPGDSEFMRNRIHLGLDGDVSDNVYVNIVAEFENTMGDTGWRPATNGRSFKLQQGYVTISDLLTENLDLTIGRQNIFLGRGFVLTSDWAGLDGLKASYSYDDLSLSALHYRLGDADWALDGTYGKEHKTGVTASYSLPVTDLTGYYIADYNSAEGQPESDQKDFIGLFAQGGFGDIRHYAEYVMQNGSDSAGDDYDESLLYVGLNYDLLDLSGLSLKADYLLATENFGSATMYGYVIDTFWYDYYLDAFGSAVTFGTIQNLEAIGTGFSFNPLSDVTFMAHYYMLADEANGDDIGDELGVKLNYAINGTSNVFVTYSQFMPEASGVDNTNFAALEYAVNF